MGGGEGVVEGEGVGGGGEGEGVEQRIPLYNYML